MTKPRPPALDAAAQSRLRWRARRGLLENDLILQRYFAQHGPDIDADHAEGLSRLLELDDNTLLDLILQRSDVPEDLQTPEVLRVLEALRKP